MESKHWTLLSNHGRVLIHIAGNPEARIREIANLIGITEKSAIKIICNLKNEDYLTVVRIGRRNKYKVNHKLRFRHSMESHKSIDGFIKIFFD